MESSVLEAQLLEKKFQDHTAVRGVSFEIKKGECFGLLGPNGAGKSTTLKMIYGSAKITGGELYILGMNAKQHIREIKSRIGVVPQDEGLDYDFTVRENLLIYAGYLGIQTPEANRRAHELLRLMRLEDASNTMVDKLSGGMKRRLAIARGMINHPELLILDEPTAGLDPQARLWIWDFLKKVKADMGSVLMTTHYMEEAESICDRIAIMDDGVIHSIGRPSDLVREHIGHQVVEFEINPADAPYYGGRLKHAGYAYQVIRSQINVHLKAGQESRAVLDVVSATKVTIRQPTLSDVFLKLAGHDLRDEPL